MTETKQTPMPDERRRAARNRVVDEHMQFERAHELDALVATFGRAAEWRAPAGSDVFRGHGEIRGYYAELFEGFPDFTFDILRRSEAAEAVIVEVVARGTHTGTWKGIPPTGKSVEFTVCVVFTFDDEDRLAAEDAYFDRLTVLTQLGVITLG